MRPPLACIALVLAALLPCAAQSQRPSSAALDSTSRRCLAVSWLSASATCEGRVLNAAGLSLAGAGAGALAGYVGGTVSPSRCLGHAEKSAVRGAIAGAALGGIGGLVTRHISRHERAARDQHARAAAQRAPARPWSWRDVRPAVVALGAVAVTGAVIGGVQGQRSPSPCTGGIAGGAATGAGAYAAGGATTVLGTMLVARFLF